MYQAGVATTQHAYEKAVHEVFEALNKMETILTGKDYVVGDQLTEADVRLYVTVVRNFCAEHSCSLIGSLRFDLIRFMSDISNATFAPFAMAILLFMRTCSCFPGWCQFIWHLQVDAETLLEE